MHALKFIFLTLATLLKQAWQLPQAAMVAIRQRKRQIARHAFEVERLDRIRNPSKYLGK